jgi:acyl-CoA synthetase (AMP-forming)/AMP-acid ligase II
VVADAAAVGIPDDRLGEVVVAFVVATVDPPGSAELLAWCRERLANYKVPRHIWVLAQLPRGAVGKIAKNELRQKALCLLS